MLADAKGEATFVIKVEAVGHDAVTLSAGDERFTLGEGDTLTLSNFRHTISGA